MVCALQLFSFLDLADDADQTLFNNMLKKQHCLQVILPEVKTSFLHLRQKGHMFDLPEIHKSSFLPRCLKKIHLTAFNCLARLFLNVILSCCHHSLCMYVCYVYFNKDQSINQYSKRDEENTCIGRTRMPSNMRIFCRSGTMPTHSGRHMFSSRRSDSWHARHAVQHVPQ